MLVQIIKLTARAACDSAGPWFSTEQQQSQAVYAGYLLLCSTVRNDRYESDSDST